VLVNSAIDEAGGLEEGRITRGARLSVSLNAESCLDALLDSLEGIEARKVRDKGVSVHIRAGLPSWTKQHQGHWHQRLWIYVKEPRPGVFGFQMQFIFHNANFTDIGFAAERLPKWAAPFAKNGLSIFRGPDKGWDGAKRLRVVVPYSILTRPKYFYAEESEEMMRSSTTQNKALKGLVESARERANKYLKFFDSAYTA